MNGLDAWLEAPYVNAAREEEAFEKWCETTGTEFDAADAWDLFYAAMEAEMDDAWESEGDRRHDARRDGES